VVIFGGAKSVSELFNDTYIYNIKEKSWIKLNRIYYLLLLATGHIPSPRAAHAAACNDKNVVYLFGGATKSGTFASNDLYMLDLSEGEGKANFSILSVGEQKPPKRYGHVLLVYKTYIVTYGGNLKNNNLANDLWVYSLPDNEWKQVETKLSPPCRVYSTIGICRFGKAKGMIMLFGGRDSEGNALNDNWGLRKHRDGSWEWVILI
jgi:protein phosphatase